MRHIPEDELHAYLDQGLSRTQCVEIESHLAECVSCRASRDRIAALRDRTTALLARLAPPLRVPPGFESIRRLAAEHASERRRRLQLMAWAASLVLAVGLGWTASSMVEPRMQVANRAVDTTVPPPAPVATVVAPPPSAAPSPPAPRADTARPAAKPSGDVRGATARLAARRDSAAEDSARASKLAVLDPAPVLELTPLGSARERGEEFDGMWRTMSWDGAQAETGQQVPHIDGLPVVKVQIQAGDQGTRPLMVVAQQLSSGQVIQMIEGPAAGVSQLLARRNMTTPDGIPLRSDSAPGGAPGDQTMAMQVGDRMLAITGALPSDSLRAMIRRLNAEMRSK
jgi:hypothetical protein